MFAHAIELLFAKDPSELFGVIKQDRKAFVE
jgi:hypothetical protein